MPRREFPRKIRAAAIARAAGRCEKCRAALKKGEAEVDHILPDVLGGEPILANAMVLCTACHAEKTAADVRRARKADRQRDKASGAIRPSGKIRNAGFAPSGKPKHERTTLPPRALYSRPGWIAVQTNIAEKRDSE